MQLMFQLFAFHHINKIAAKRAKNKKKSNLPPIQNKLICIRNENSLVNGQIYRRKHPMLSKRESNERIITVIRYQTIMSSVFFEKMHLQRKIDIQRNFNLPSKT